MYFWKYILAKKAGLSQQKCNMALYGLPVLPIAEAFEKTLTGNPITITDAIAEDALSLQVSFEPTQSGTPWIDSEPETSPYLSKVIPRGNREYYGLVGGTVAWNQLVDTNTTEVPTISGRKYLTVINGTKSIMNGNGTSISVTGGTDNVHDLTLMFGSTIANYIYSLETAQAGSGIAWLKANGFLTKDYYPYNPGELISVKTSGHKIGSTTYPIDNIELRGLFKLDSANKLYAEGDLYPPSGSASRKYGIVDLGTLDWSTTSASNVYATTNEISDMVRAGIDGTPQLDILCGKYVATPMIILAANLPDKMCSINVLGKKLMIKDSAYATASDLKTALSGTYFVYPLATPTTESLTPYTSPIDVEAGGTEKFIDDRTVPVPVGNETYYAAEYAVEGKTGVTVNHSATSSDTPTEYEVQFTSQGTVYGGTVDIVTGELTVTWGYIASYNGETLPGEWMSSKDVYASGTTPSTGAEVAYELATPQTYNLTPEQVTMLLGNNYLVTEDGTITLTYMAGK